MSAASGCAGVLVVEDDVDITEALIQVLESEGMAVRAAGNGQIALDLLRAPGAPLPCVILLDLMMPVMDGRALLEKMRADPALSDVPVIVSTSAPHLAPRDVPVVAKPIDVRKMIEWLRRYCDPAPASA